MSPWLGTQIKAQILTINQIHVTDQNVEPWICILIKQSYIILVLGGGLTVQQATIIPSHIQPFCKGFFPQIFVILWVV